LTVTLIDSPVANVANIARALRTTGAELIVTRDPEVIAGARKIVLPGVGSFVAAMRWLTDARIDVALREAVERGATLLGICVGHQVLFEASHEMGFTRGLGLIEGEVRRFEGALPVPQIGWNRVSYGAPPPSSALRAPSPRERGEGQHSTLPLGPRERGEGERATLLPLAPRERGEGELATLLALGPRGRGEGELSTLLPLAPRERGEGGPERAKRVEGPGEGSGATSLFDGIPPSTSFYFVNSYAASQAANEIARADYDGPFTAAIQRGNVFGVQFHPEKSSTAGLRVLRNFVAWT
jgi:imidazoleglycerol phosphate synthase glutamine amidotransferase subunit HisH